MNRAEPSIPGAKRSERLELARDALVIVATGIVLGVASNSIGRSSQPARGLPWIATPRPLQSADTRVGVVAGAIPAEASSDPAAEPARSRPDPPPPSQPRARSVAGSPREGAQGKGSPPAATGDAGTNRPAPPAEQPLQVGLATVVRLVEARSALVVDARERSEFAAGHIPGAVNLPYDEAIRDPAPLAKLDAGGHPILVYCSGTRCDASRMLAEMLVRDFGKRNVLIYEGGFTEWAAAGKSVARGEP